MNALRIAVVMMTAQRYFAMVINFGMVAVVSRILRPEEIGLAVIGSSIAVLAMTLREFASANFLVQKKDLTPEDIRVASSILALATIISAAGLWAIAPWVASTYGDPVLVAYLRVSALAMVLELVTALITSLLQRHMSFGKVAAINSVQVTVAALATIAFAVTGFSAMSYAWAWLVAATCTGGLALYLWRDVRMFRPTIRGWREMLTFGGYYGANQVLYRIYEAVPYLFLGRIISMDAVGLYNRAMTICQLPDKMFLSGVMAVSLPAFSAHAREDGAMKAPYLRGLTYISALQWPALAVIAILAHPIVHLLLGSQWTGAVPILQIIALAWMLYFSAELNYPVLVAIGAIRATFLRALVAWPLSAVIVSLGAFFGLKAMAFSLFFAIAIQAYVSINPLCHHIGLKWREVFRAVRKSAAVTLLTITGPLAVVGLSDHGFELPIIHGLATGVLAGFCWLAALWLTKHPLLGELLRILALLRRPRAQRELPNAGPHPAE
jgi:O-antigen/teichoic acid export membrane protein